MAAALGAAISAPFRNPSRTHGLSLRRNHLHCCSCLAAGGNSGFPSPRSRLLAKRRSGILGRAGPVSGVNLSEAPPRTTNYEVQLLMWMISLERLPTADRLVKFLDDMPTICCLCRGSEESADHLFAKCSFATEVRELICSAIGQHSFNAISVQGLIHL